MSIIAYIHMQVHVYLHSSFTLLYVMNTFHVYSLYSMTLVVVLFAYLIKLNISTRKGVTKILPLAISTLKFYVT